MATNWYNILINNGNSTIFNGIFSTTEDSDNIETISSFYESSTNIFVPDANTLTSLPSPPYTPEEISSDVTTYPKSAYGNIYGGSGGNSKAIYSTIQRYYPPSSENISVWQGIRPYVSNYLFCGTNSSTNVGVICIAPYQYQATSMSTAFTTMSYPNAATTSLYGPDVISSNLYHFVGTYTNGSDTNIYPFIYTGDIDSTSIADSTNYLTIDINSLFTAPISFAHSVMNQLCVLNTGDINDGSGGVAVSYIYDINDTSFTKITDPSLSLYQTITAYGIYYNGGTSYTIVGGCSADSKPIVDIYHNGLPIAYGRAFIIDYDSSTKLFSNTTILDISTDIDIFTHIQGISYDSIDDIYLLSMDVVKISTSISTGYFVKAVRNSGVNNGFSIINNGITNIGTGFTANSVANNVVVGIVKPLTTALDVFPYQTFISNTKSFSADGPFIATTIPDITPSANLFKLYYGGGGFANNFDLIDIYDTNGKTLSSPLSVTFNISPSNYVCFKEDSKILTDNGYIPIQYLKNGDLVKTTKNGYKPISLIGKSKIYHQEKMERVGDQLYRCGKENYPELFEDLIITGYHSILVDNFKNNDEMELTIKANGKIFVTDGKFRLPACADSKASIYEKSGLYMIYHIALEHDDYYMNYGIYANGLLVETCSNRYLKELSNMELI